MTPHPRTPARASATPQVGPGAPPPGVRAITHERGASRSLDPAVEARPLVGLT